MPREPALRFFGVRARVDRIRCRDRRSSGPAGRLRAEAGRPGRFLVTSGSAPATSSALRFALLEHLHRMLDAAGSAGEDDGGVGRGRRPRRLAQRHREQDEAERVEKDQRAKARAIISTLCNAASTAMRATQVARRTAANGSKASRTRSRSRAAGRLQVLPRAPAFRRRSASKARAPRRPLRPRLPDQRVERDLALEQHARPDRRSRRCRA